MLFALAGLALAGTAWAEPDSPGPAASGNPLDTRIDLAVTGAAPADVFRGFGKLMSAEVSIDPAVKKPVTVELHDVRVRTLLDAVCESVGCRWDYLPGKPGKAAQLRVTAEPSGEPTPSGRAALAAPIDLKVNKADGRDLLKTFAQILGVPLSLDPAITGTVSLSLENTPCGQALDAACEALSCKWELTEGSAPTLRITAKARK